VNYTGSNPPNNPKKNTVAIIPARYDSVRLPGKALLDIAGTPMVCVVAERALAAATVSRAIVATDDERIVDAARNAGFEAMITRSNHASGTDRIAEVAEALDGVDIIVNVQGDEPLISPETIDGAVSALIDDPDCGIATTWESMESVADVLNPDVVKIVVDENSRAVYFSRSPVPYPRDAAREHGNLQAALENDASLLARFRKHTGLYVYRRDVLLAFAKWPQSTLERLESLEQLRALEHGVKIKAIEATSSSIGVDTPQDLERVRLILSRAAPEIGAGRAGSFEAT
jgi:3-deoxy-manno-octulosonate cytidylyltransferase (CMP-KDO synthetase)